MSLWIHITLLFAVLVTPVPLCVLYRQGPPRSLHDAALDLWPYLLLAVFSCLLLSTGGEPTIEWFLPALATLALAYFCRSAQVYRISWWTLLGVSIVLCVNLLILIYPYGDYARNVSRSLEFANMKAMFTKNQARQSLEESFDSGKVIEPGPVAKILKQPDYDNLKIVTAEPEWHTGLTFVYRLKSEKAILWYPGGAIETGSQNLELRKVD